MKRYRDYSTYLKEKYGEKIYKLPVNLPVTCPNRDGTRAHGGCIFCGEVGAGFETLDNMVPVKEQLSVNRAYMGKAYKAGKFIAYLQNYTNTYLPVEDFEKVLFDCAEPDIVAVSVSTRPDCVHKEYLEAAKRVKQKTGLDVTFELGLQSVNTHTLKTIRRGHTLAEFVGAVLRIREYGFSVGVHLIPNLPWDEDIDLIEAAELLSVLHVDTVKLHNLFVMDDTALGNMYREGDFTLCSYEEYFRKVALFLTHLDPDVAIERFFARCPEPGCLFSNWGRSWRFLQNELMDYFDKIDLRQGSETKNLEGILYQK